MKTKKETLDEQIDREFNELAEPFILEKLYQSQKEISHHHHSNIFNHEIGVAKYCYIVARKHPGKYDIKSLIFGALFHDYFLYNWRFEKNRRRPHAYAHPKIAYNNLIKQYEVNKKEKNMILAHMWPLMFFYFPMSKEAWLLCFADKVLSFLDFFDGDGKWDISKKLRYHPKTKK